MNVPAASPAAAPTAILLPDGTAVVRRIIASDNSCLFNAVGYVMEGSINAATHLRYVDHPPQENPPPPRWGAPFRPEAGDGMGPFVATNRKGAESEIYAY